MRTDHLIALEGETLDEVLWRGAALGPESLVAVCSANPGLCDQVTLAAGQPVFLPPVVLESPDVGATLARVNLWD